jgi:MFS family permease
VILGGLLTQGPGWRWVFFVNVPVGILTALLAARLLGESRDESRTRSYDVLGAVSGTTGLILLVYALVNTNQYGWSSARTIGDMIGAGALLLLFVVIEALFASHPLVPLQIFRSRTLSGANLVALLLGLSIFAVFYFLVQMGALAGVRGVPGGIRADEGGSGGSQSRRWIISLILAPIRQSPSVYIPVESQQQLELAING